MDKIVNKEKYKPRLIDGIIGEYLKACGAVCVEGPKWCGKTWTSSYHSESEFQVGNPDGNFQNRSLAAMAPALILEGTVPRLIDEWQEVPQIWDAVRSEVDKRGLSGQFILTGSSTPDHKGVLHSGAGRIVKLKMRTMSLYESGDSTGDISLYDICTGKAGQKFTGDVSLVKLADLTVRGGFPGNINNSGRAAEILPRAYIDSLLEDDVREIDGTRYDIHKIQLLLKSLARNESTLATKKSLIRDMLENDGEAINQETVSSYLNLFSRMFITANQESFSPGVRSSLRIRQAEKRHLTDPALVCALLNLNTEKLIGDLETFGFLFEALVERDLWIYANSVNAKLYHYRDYEDNEIDAVIELEDGKWCAFEIKLGFNQVEAAAANLLKISDMFAKKGIERPSALCVICGMSSAAFMRPDGVYVVPITALKN